MQLHVFEPRYRQLFADLEEGESIFGIPYTVGRLNRGFGSRCRLVKVLKRYNSGESDVLVECEGLFKIEDFQSMKDDKLYPFGSVRLLRSLSHEIASSAVIEAYEKLANALEGTTLRFQLVNTEYSLALMASLNYSSEEKHMFIQLPSPEKRDKTLLGMINLLSSLVSQEKRLENGIYLS